MCFASGLDSNSVQGEGREETKLLTIFDNYTHTPPKILSNVLPIPKIVHTIFIYATISTWIAVTIAQTWDYLAGSKEQIVQETNKGTYNEEAPHQLSH